MSILLTILFIFCLQPSYSQPGKPDSSFGGNGFIAADFPKHNLFEESALQILIKKDGTYIVLLGSANNDAKAIVHIFLNGDLDKSFGSAGYLAINGLTPAKAALQNDEKIVVAGTSGDHFDGSDFALTRYNANGSVDSTFGNKGVQATNFNLRDHATSVAIHSDGKIVVGGFTEDNGAAPYFDPNTFFAVARYYSNGSPDTSFSDDGKQITDFGFRKPPGEKDPGTPELDYAYSTAVQNDGKIILAGTVNYGSRFALARYNINGSPDTTFSNDGIQTTGFAGEATARAVSIATNGNIILAGEATVPNAVFALACYYSNGSLNLSFSDDGKQTGDFGCFASAKSVAIQADGKIVVAGSAGGNFVVARYTIDGLPDPGFNGDGKQVTDFSGSNDGANSIALQEDGEIVAAGETNGGRNADFALARYSINGSPDNDFSADGKETGYIPSGQGGLNSITVQNDGKIVVAGNARDTLLNHKVFLSRYNSNGSIDSTFYHGSEEPVNFGGTEEYAYSVATQKDGKVVLAGFTIFSTGYPPDSTYFAIARFNTDGTPDNTFSGEGKVITNVGNSFRSEAYSLAIQNDGKIVVAGAARDGNYDYSAAVVRYNTDGSLDKSFSMDGIWTYPASDFDLARKVVIQNDGKIVVVGGENNDFVIIRLNADGSLDNTFSTDGKQTTDFDFNNDVANAADILNDGKLLVAGFTIADQTSSNFALAKYNTDGSLDTTFGGDGKLTTDFGYYDYVTSVNIQADGKIVAVGSINEIQQYPYPLINAFHIALARYNNNGLPDSNFGLKGKIVTTAGKNESGTDAALYNSKLYVTSGNGVFQDGNNLIFSFDLAGDGEMLPVVNLITPAANSTYLAGGNVYLTAEASDADGTISEVKFYSDTTLLHTATDTPYAFKWEKVKKGNYTLTAKATDNSGLVSISDTVHISVVPNNPPSISIISPANGQIFASPAVINLEAAALDPDGRIITVDFYNGSNLLNPIPERKLPYTYQWQNMSPGAYTITAKAMDNWGAVTTSSAINFTVTSSALPVSNTPGVLDGKIGIEAALSFQLAPNPANSILTIYTTGLRSKKQATLSVVSPLGVVIKTKQLTGLSQTITLDVSSLVSGMYVVKMTNGDKIMYRQFVKL